MTTEAPLLNLESPNPSFQVSSSVVEEGSAERSPQGQLENRLCSKTCKTSSCLGFRDLGFRV